MNDVQMDDLKQYISSTVSQSAESVKTELGTEIQAFKTELGNEIQSLKSDLLSVIMSVKSELRTEIQAAKKEILIETRDGFASIADSVTLAHDADAEQDRRLTRLEQRAA